MPRRLEQEESEWMLRKKDILSLYVEQDKPLSDVMHAMATHGFIRTKPQYERSFKRWHVSKNVRKEEWNFILDRLDERKRPTNVEVRGVTVSQARLQRQKLRRRDKTFDLCKSRLHPQPRSRTPPGIEISTPPPTVERDCQELSEGPEHDEHLNEEVPTAGNPQGSLVHARDDDCVLSPAATAPDVTAVSDVSGHISTETPSEATHLQSLSPHSVSDSTQRSCSDILYEYMCAAISVIEDEGFDDVPITERYALRYLNERPVKELLYDGHDEFLQFFVKHNLPQDDLYDILRAFNTADDLALLRRLVFLSKSDGNSFAEVKWRQFCENLLFDAVKDENEALLEMLLDVGVDANARGHSRQFHDSTATFKAFNALQIAILGGNKNVIDILNSCCARIFTGSPVVDSDFLSGAFTRNTIDFAKPQLASEATWHSKPGGKGLDILVHAVEQSYDNIVDILFEAGFNPYSRADRGDFATGWVPRDSAFMVSLRTSKTRYLGKFLTFPYHALDRKRRQERLRQLTAGYVTARCTENVALGKAILDAGWRPDHVKLAMGYDYVQEYLHNALEQAVERGYCEEVRCLLQMGANPNLLSYTYVSGSIIRPLHSAIEEGNVAIVRQLVEARADVNVLSSRSNLTPLQKAVYGSSLEIVSILVEAGANVNSTTRKWSRSAVEIAADKGNLEMVTYLLESGANVQGRHNHNYRRTLYWAQNHGHNSVVDLLQDWKRSRHGEQDCDAIGNIMSSTTEEELDLLSRVYD